VAVTIVEMADRILDQEEPEVSELMTEILRREGLTIHTGVVIERAEPSGVSGATLHFADGGTVSADRLLVATGRRSDLAALGVAALGLDEDAHALPVDDRMRIQDGVWGVGDVTGHGAFTHVAMYQARICVADILGDPVDGADYRALPRVTFTDPEVGSVGLTEAQARRAGGEVRVMHESIAKSARGWIHRGEGLVKLIEQDGVLVGGTSMGPMGGEVLAVLTLAVHARVPVDTLKSMIYAYPTFHRAIESALWA
jgi:pyruvate/2-oxoglutarate dehydrogenase complex dihydrolipoamide dehydrogenase (E3) component